MSDINFLLYRPSKDNRVYLFEDNRIYLELNIESAKALYQMIINSDGKIAYNQVNCKTIDVLPVTPKTKKLLQFFNSNKNLIMKLLEQANQDKKIDENFNRLWWLLKEETELLEL